jgi:hypothetical protein
MSSLLSTARLETVGGIPYKLVEGYPKFTFSENKSKATEKYIVASNQLGAFYTESFPSPFVLGGFIDLPPRRYMPGAPWMVTKEIQAEPHTGDLPGDPLLTDTPAPAGTYDTEYMVTIMYEAKLESEDDQRDPRDPITFLERSISIGGEFISVPPQKTKHAEADVGQDPQEGASEGTTEPQLPIVKTIPTGQLQYKWSYVLQPNWTDIWGYLGKVNNSKEEVFFDLEKECVMFLGVNGNQKFLWNGSSVRVQPWDLTFNFSVKRVEERKKVYGWNHVWIPKKQEWRKLLRLIPDGSGGTTEAELHERVDLMELFKAG